MTCTTRGLRLVPKPLRSKTFRMCALSRSTSAISSRSPVLIDDGEVLVLFDFLDQVQDPSPHLDVADPHERLGECQPIARCHEVRILGR